MKNWKRLLALLLSGAMALSLFACKPDESAESPSADPSAEVSDPAEPDASPAIEVDLGQGPLEFSAGVSADDVLLTVNGGEVHADLFLYMLAMNCMQAQPYLSYLGLTLDNMAESLLNDTVNMAAYHVIMRQKAAELGCLLTDAQTEEIQTAIKESDLESVAPYWGLTDESGEFIFAMTDYYNNVLEAVTHEPSEEELEEYMVAQGLYRVKHILFKTVDDNRQPLPEDQIAAKKAQAEDTLAQLQAASDLPALFDQLMNELSEDGRDESSGTLYAPDGYLAAPGDMVAEFETASQALQEGELSGIVESEYGCHIILRLPTSPFTDEEKTDCRESFRPDAMEQLADQWQEEAEIIRADALSALDVTSFYDRMAAYQNALAESLAPAESAPANNSTAPSLSKAEIATAIRSILDDSGVLGDCEYVESKNTFILYTLCPLTISEVEFVLHENGTSENWENYKSTIEKQCKTAVSEYSAQGYSDVTCIVTLLDPDEEIMCTATDGVLSYVHPSLS